VTYRLAALVAVLSIALAACGTTGDGESGDTTTTTEATTESTTAPEESSTTTTEPEVDDDAQARAESIDITLDDFPGGWDASPHEESDEPDLFTTCSEFTLDDLTLGEYFTEDFTSGDLSANDGQSIEIGTRVIEDEETATEILDVMPQPDFVQCANEEFQSNFGSDYVSGEVEARQFVGIGDQTEGFAGNIVVTDGGEEVPLHVAFVAIRTGDLITGLTAIGVGQDLDTDVLDDLGFRIEELQASA
jgi:hypothetical protein